MRTISGGTCFRAASIFHSDLPVLCLKHLWTDYEGTVRNMESELRRIIWPGDMHRWFAEDSGMDMITGGNFVG